LRDEPTDKKVGKKTLAVRFGPGFARAEYLAAFTLALILPFVLAFRTDAHWFACLSALIIIPGRSAIRQITSGVKGIELNETLALTGKLIIIYSVLFSLGWWIG
ncbi:MAG: 1,4-dihydroxy-2-naphthoate polyprenyltransferase, partial [SAR324 cluster bacterium]|nr:1,4-dihydroxy-2-naphthoate polyprenyltransferase [SAR324 cluster bacterium]